MNLWNYIQQGGVIMYLLVLLNIVGFALMIAKFLILKKETANAETTAQDIRARMPRANSDSMLELAKQGIATHSGTVEDGFDASKSVASVSPLLGLLGTVVGILVALQVLSHTGMNEPSNYAQGISLARIATVG